MIFILIQSYLALLLMVILNSMTGGLDSQSGFDSNFNMLLPLLMKGNLAEKSIYIKKKSIYIEKKLFDHESLLFVL